MLPLNLFLLLSIAPFILAEQAGFSDPWAVYYPDAFHENNMCSSLNCLSTEVCLVHGNTALCVKENELDKIQADKQKHHGEIDKDHGEKLANAAYAKLEKYKRRVQKMQRSLHDSHLNEVDHLLKHDLLAERDPANTATLRHTSYNGGDVCSQDDLSAMGERLLKWFGDVQKEVGGQADPALLPAHRVQCKDSVAWMFSQWDGDQSGTLTLEELNSMEGDPYEHCIKPFVDRCDDNADNKISLDEWCDCFVFVGKPREEPPCHSARHKVDPHLLGVFLPRCDTDGYYRPEQCHENRCWCVDRWGREFDRSSVHGKRPDCGQYARPSVNETQPNARDAVLDIEPFTLPLLGADQFAGIETALPRLHSVLMRHLRIETVAPGALEPLHNVQCLDLSNNEIGRLDKGIFFGLRNLRTLILAKNRIRQVTRAAFSDLPNVRVLDLSYNSLVTLPEDVFAALPRLQVLHLEGNKMTFVPTTTFHQAPSLFELYLSNNPLINVDISKCYLLRKLVANSCLLDTFPQLPNNLQTLHLRDNVLTQIKATDLTRLHTINEVSLSGNPWLCDCTTLPLLQWFYSSPAALIDGDAVACGGPEFLYLVPPKTAILAMDECEEPKLVPLNQKSPHLVPIAGTVSNTQAVGFDERLLQNVLDVLLQNGELVRQQVEGSLARQARQDEQFLNGQTVAIKASMMGTPKPINFNPNDLQNQNELGVTQSAEENAQPGSGDGEWLQLRPIASGNPEPLNFDLNDLARVLNERLGQPQTSTNIPPAGGDPTTVPQNVPEGSLTQAQLADIISALVAANQAPNNNVERQFTLGIGEIKEMDATTNSFTTILATSMETTPLPGNLAIQDDLQSLVNSNGKGDDKSNKPSNSDWFIITLAIIIGGSLLACFLCILFAQKKKHKRSKAPIAQPYFIGSQPYNGVPSVSGAVSGARPPSRTWAAPVPPTPSQQHGGRVTPLDGMNCYDEQQLDAVDRWLYDERVVW